MHNEDLVYNKIQWIIKSLYQESVLTYFESCALDTIRTAAAKFIKMGILGTQKIQVKKNVFEHYLIVSKTTNEKLKEHYHMIS